jgi:iron complex outermembrane recepter protein
MKKSYTIQHLILFLLLFVSSSLFAQKTVSGKITDAKGDGMAGVSILEKGTSNGTISDANGSYSLKVSDKGTLVLSFIGMKSVEIAIGKATSFDVQMEEGGLLSDDLVVTATRQPVRKLETTTAISIVSAKQLENTKPEGISEAIRGVPGMFVRHNQGRFRGAIFTRGFPDGSGNGLVYTGLLVDGMPALATSARPPDFAIGIDPSFDRVEVVRGAAGALFGHGSAAGVVNMITKVGGDKLAGMLRITNYNNNMPTGAVNADGARDGVDYRIDGNINGPIADNLRFNLGGYYLKDRGFRNLGYDDVGGQMRGNIDYLFKDKSGSVRLYGHLVNVTIQNMIDIPYRFDNLQPKDGWSIFDSYYSPALDTLKYAYNNSLAPTLPKEYGTPGELKSRNVKDVNKDGNYARGGHVGLSIIKSIGDFTVSNKFRYQNYDHGTKFNLSVSPFSTDAPASNVRVLIDGDGNDTDLMNELRLEKVLDFGETRHRFTLGNYTSKGFYTPNTWSLTGWQSNDRADLRFRGFGPGFATPTRGGASRVDKYTVTTTSFFAGDEIKVGEKLIVNVSGRYDDINMDLKGFYTDSINEISRTEIHKDWSASIGVNYKINPRSAIYGNMVRAFRAPDYDAYSAVKKGTNDPKSTLYKPRIDKNEVVYNAEIGYRTGFGDVGVDVAGFYTFIDNRLATVYVGAIATSQPLGNNRITGAEISFNYVPSAIKGLTLNTSLTLQKAVFQDFKIPIVNTAANPVISLNKDSIYGLNIINEGKATNGRDVLSIDLKGKQIPVIPNTMWNFDASYDSKYFGVNVSSNLNTGMYFDATNLLKADNQWWINAGVYGKIPVKKSAIKVSLTAKNIFQPTALGQGVYLATTDAVFNYRQRVDIRKIDASKTYLPGIPIMPRRILLSLEYQF